MLIQMYQYLLFHLILIGRVHYPMVYLYYEKIFGEQYKLEYIVVDNISI